MNHPHILAAIQSELWAIAPDALQQLVAIAQGFGDPEAVIAKTGARLNNTRNVVVRDGVAIVSAIGPVFRYANLFSEISGATSLQNLATDFQAAVDDPSINAIIYQFDSPGGQASGISEHAQQIRAASKIKPVIAYVSNLSASAAYWLASAASEIVVSDTALLGSIGVVMQAGIDSPDGTVKFISSQSPLKQVDPTTDAGRIAYQRMVDELAAVFIDAVATNRNTDTSNVLTQFGGGGILIAADAIKVGMADRIGTLEQLITELSVKKTTLRGTTLMSITRETLASEHPDLVKAITDEGYATGFAEGKLHGANDERQRIQDIEALSIPGHDALLSTLKYDGKTTAAEAALQILKAEQQTRIDMSTRLAADTPMPVSHAATSLYEGEAAADTDLVGEAKWQHEWQTSAALQQEFKTQASYVAYQSAVANGRVKQLGAK